MKLNNMKNLIAHLQESLRIGINDSPEYEAGMIKFWNCKGQCFEVKDTHWFVYMDPYNHIYKVNAYGDILFMCGYELTCDDFENFSPKDIVFQSDDLKECVEFILKETADNKQPITKLINDIKAGKYKNITNEENWSEILNNLDVEFNKFWNVAWALSVLNDIYSEKDCEGVTGYRIEADEVATYEDTKKLYRQEYDEEWQDKSR